MTSKDLRGILINIVKAWPYNKDYPWKRLNTFSILHNRSDWSKANFGHNHQDVLGLEYWVRGQNTLQNDTRQSGYLMMESTYDEVRNIKENTVCHVIMLTVAFDQNQECEYCPYKAKVSKYDLYEASKEILRQVIRELCSYEKFMVEIDGETKEIYSTQKAIDCNTDISIVNRCPGSLDGMIMPEQQQIFQQELGSASLIGASIKIKIEDCIPIPSIELDYCKEDCITDGIVICECVNL